MSYGDGFITRERGRFRVRVPDGKGGHKTVASGIATEDEARQLLAAARIARVDLGDGMTLRRLGTKWLHAIRDFKSWKQVHCSWHSIVLDAPIADVPLDLLTRLEIQGWADTLPEKPKKRSVLRDGKRRTVELATPISRKSGSHALGYVKQALEWACSQGFLEQNPAKGVRVPKDRRAVEEPVSYLSAEQVFQLLDFEGFTLEQRTVFALAICQCPREGELAGMDWERVDWEKRAWWIGQSWQGSTKNGRGRWQELIELAFDALRAWWEHCGRPTHGIVFPSPQRDAWGKPKRYARGHDWGWADHPSKDRTRLGAWRLAGITAKIRFHELRDTCATHLLSGTFGEPWPVNLVSKHLGHSSTAITEARYAHTTREALRKAAAGVRIEKPAARHAAGPATEPPTAALQARETAVVSLGSGGRDRTYDQSVNRGSVPVADRGVTADAAALWRVRREVVDLALAGLPVPRELVELLADLSASHGQRLTDLALRVLRGGPGALEAALELATVDGAPPALDTAQGSERAS